MRSAQVVAATRPHTIHQKIERHNCSIDEHSRHARPLAYNKKYEEAASANFSTRRSMTKRSCEGARAHFKSAITTHVFFSLSSINNHHQLRAKAEGGERRSNSLKHKLSARMQTQNGDEVRRATSRDFIVGSHYFAQVSSLAARLTRLQSAIFAS